MLIAWLQLCFGKNSHISEKATWKNAEVFHSVDFLRSSRQGWRRHPRAGSRTSTSRAGIFVSEKGGSALNARIACAVACSLGLHPAWGIFQRKLCACPDCLCPRFHSLSRQPCRGKCGYAFCKTAILYFITKKDQLWKARLNHSFHFLMGFGWIE